MSRLRIYISGPLTNGGTLGPQDVQANIDIAVQTGLALVHYGFSPMVPHLSYYMDPKEQLGLDTWIDVDRSWVEVADAVLRLPGKSVGADAEVAHALAEKVPVVHSVQELLMGREDGHYMPLPAYKAGLFQVGQVPAKGV